MKNLGMGWIADHGPKASVFNSRSLCTLIQIASIPANLEQLLDEKIRSFDDSVNYIAGMTCRVWVLRVIEVLIQNGLAHCNDLPGLETECMAFGNQHRIRDFAKFQPAPVEVLRLSS